MNPWDVAIYVLVIACTVSLGCAFFTLFMMLNDGDDKPAIINIGVMVASIALLLLVVHLSPRHSII